MTIKELYEETKSLLFDDFLKYDANFLHAVHSALRTVFARFDILGEKKFFLYGGAPSRRIPELVHKGGEVERVKLSGASYSMMLYGCGEFTVKSQGGAVRHEFDCDGERFSDFFDGECEMEFSGKYSYAVKNLVCFEEIYSPSSEDIPTGLPFYKIDLRKKLSDYLAPASPPMDEKGAPIKSASVYDGILSVDSGYRGELTLIYKRRAPYDLHLESTADISAPEEYCTPLPTLTAAYLLSLTNSDLANEYTERGEELMKNLSLSVRKRADVSVVGTNGWA